MEKELKQKLEDEKILLEEELANLGSVDEKGDWEARPEGEEIYQEVQDEADMAERAEEYASRSDKLNLLEKKLNEVKNAIEKIDAKTYGLCEVCENNIEEDRLSVNPSATTCKNCMNKK